MVTRRLTPDVLDPQLRRTFRFFPNPPVRHGWQRRLTRAALTLLPNPETPPDVRYERVDLGPGTAAHVFTPAGGGNGGALLWLHGGGMLIGAAVQDQARCTSIARELGITVVSADYRLAPEHPFPAPLDDCHTVWRWLVAHAAERGIDPARVAVGGQSAGGGLAAGLVQRLHDEGGPQPAAQWLFCPMLDDRTAANRELDAVRHFVWNNSSNHAGWRAYLGQEPGGDGVAPYAAPARRADLSGLPPAWIGTGDIELFFAEDRDYAQALTAAGVDCTLDVVPGAPHGFESLAASTDLARRYVARSRDWLARQVAPDPGTAGA
ncbi:alpha/beta hydrolase [Georgenia sp. TF02-10]|uniref:alpha/beta hydrolase n=1 Tax=Georgenia sp. TF02-10 TaxID=2917725 RepID=UPI001FA7413F|nr:alpha/beta hydrolase [Georgenia sp. TF02-10]UNX56235.1 alpha/beta hydrolase [Georgenia sp. TF02-10]